MKRSILTRIRSSNNVANHYLRGQTKDQADKHLAAAQAKRDRKAQKRLLADKRAVTALEYGIIAGVLGLVLIGIFTKFSGHLSALFSTIGKSI